MRLDPPRSRLHYALLALGTIPLGLASRAVPGLPAWLSKGAGDALYATMSFWLVGFLFPALVTTRAALAAMLFCFVVEASQLWRTPLFDAIRATRLGGLALGHGFHAMDLVYYVAGALLGAALEYALRKKLFKSGASRPTTSGGT
jgi:hypothetical protein